MTDLRKALRSTELRGPIRFNEPMAAHTSFRVGGPADAYYTPVDVHDLQTLQRLRNDEGIPLFILGAGANILVADDGIRGVAVDMKRFNYRLRQDTTITLGAGLAMSEATRFAADANLAGLEFIHGMPGSVGGSVWMNARCYEESIGDRLVSVGLVDESGEILNRHVTPAEFSYKKSPFQTLNAIIFEADFGLESGNSDSIRRTMMKCYEDRKHKGHYDAPSVGSVFKNNRSFGAPTGKILDDLGVRGYAIGGASIACYHANIVINRSNATADDILSVIEYAEKIALDRKGFKLEREVLLVGEWQR